MQHSQPASTPEGIVQKNGVGTKVGCPGDVQALTLTTREIHAAQATNRLISLR
jgi:hypothetical protein